MKFAMNGTLYRGSKPVMWSVVEKTALAEAEVEYQDYQSDTIWVKFPLKFAMPSRFTDVGPAGRIGRHLDDDAVDHSGQPRHLVLIKDCVWLVRGDEGARRQLGQSRR